jgi:hypothetical protein
MSEGPKETRYSSRRWLQKSRKLPPHASQDESTTWISALDCTLPGASVSSLVMSGALVTARAVAAFARREGFDLVICGKHTVDGETAQVGPEVAELLGVPHVSGKAPTFQMADVGVSANAVELFPALTEALRRRLGGCRRSMTSAYTSPMATSDRAPRSSSRRR